MNCLREKLYANCFGESRLTKLDTKEVTDEDIENSGEIISSIFGCYNPNIIQIKGDQVHYYHGLESGFMSWDIVDKRCLINHIKKYRLNLLKDKIISEITHNDKTILGITPDGIIIGERTLSVNVVYENLEIMLAIAKIVSTISDNNNERASIMKQVYAKLNRLEEYSDDTLVIIPLGNGLGGYYVPVKRTDIKTKTSITIYTVPYNIGNIIGAGGSNIKTTMSRIKNNIPDSKLKYIKVKSL